MLLPSPLMGVFLSWDTVSAREHSQNLKPRAKGRISLLGTEVRKTPKGVTTNY